MALNQRESELMSMRADELFQHTREQTRLLKDIYLDLNRVIRKALRSPHAIDVVIGDACINFLGHVLYRMSVANNHDHAKMDECITWWAQRLQCNFWARVKTPALSEDHGGERD